MLAKRGHRVLGVDGSRDTATRSATTCARACRPDYRYADARSPGRLPGWREDTELGALRPGGCFHVVTHEAHRRTP
ncbi:hypothetical protein [Microtetraspora malaysiensis]|uniref:hypothetical protein n=1 Tax=Microtetraspora malaysiensis TaxID=161358 RepID=UPI001FDEC41F|nr:hypothetical protein [Microtetraspora malaysiensis]